MPKFTAEQKAEWIRSHITHTEIRICPRCQQNFEVSQTAEKDCLCDECKAYLDSIAQQLEMMSDSDLIYVIINSNRSFGFLMPQG
jgi:predicted amidophosphoribosyltransferase